MDIFASFWIMRLLTFEKKLSPHSLSANKFISRNDVMFVSQVLEVHKFFDVCGKCLG